MEGGRGGGGGGGGGGGNKERRKEEKRRDERRGERENKILEGKRRGGKKRKKRRKNYQNKNKMRKEASEVGIIWERERQRAWREERHREGDIQREGEREGESQRKRKRDTENETKRDRQRGRQLPLQRERRTEMLKVFDHFIGEHSHTAVLLKAPWVKALVRPGGDACTPALGRGGVQSRTMEDNRGAPPPVFAHTENLYDLRVQAKPSVSSSGNHLSDDFYLLRRSAFAAVKHLYGHSQGSVDERSQKFAITFFAETDAIEKSR